MTTNFTQKISNELNLQTAQVSATVELLDGGATIPFLARYRKEATGNLDEVQITSIRDRLQSLRDLESRREFILESIDQQGKLTDELKNKILAAQVMSVLEDLYLPYKPKRKTKASVAKEKGLEPLAEKIFAQEGIDVIALAETFLDEEKKVLTADDALHGARDIIAEWINENMDAREHLRKLFWDKGCLNAKLSKGKEEEASKYKDYWEWEQAIDGVPSHRVLAVFRAEKEKLLSVYIKVPEDDANSILTDIFIKGDGEDSGQVRIASEDSFKRLLAPSLENECRQELKRGADDEAIKIFKKNLDDLLMSPPLGQKRVMAIDPGYRTGSKVVCLDEKGDLLENQTIYWMGEGKKADEAKDIICGLCKNHKIDVIAIGNGTASRETEQFIKSLGLSKDIKIVFVNESGASIYSASEAAREEFPDHDITVRGSVSIGRRLMDPLAELVKIDSKSIGVGQYQHDVDQKLLKNGLDDVVISCVNRVGAEVNSASKQLLSYVSGLNNSIAKKIIAQRKKKGAFKSRKELKGVSGLGAKAFEQCAGFLRIREGDNPLDASAVHPESYFIIDLLKKDLKCTTEQLIDDDSLRKNIDWNKYASERIGLPTLIDIKEELEKPGRDPREPLQIFDYKEGVNSLEDLESGMILPGVITNITAFGAFVDVGVHQDGLLHISQMSEKFIKDPREVVSIHQKVEVKVLEIDIERKRIALTLKA